MARFGSDCGVRILWCETLQLAELIMLKFLLVLSALFLFSYNGPAYADACIPRHAAAPPKDSLRSAEPYAVQLSDLRANAGKGDADAQIRLGEALSHNGNNPAEAAKWFHAAFKTLRPQADKGDSIAQQHVGDIYANGWGLRQNYAEAYFWYSLEKMHSPSFSHYAGCWQPDYKILTDVKAHLTAAQISATDIRINKWMEIHQVKSGPTPWLH